MVPDAGVVIGEQLTLAVAAFAYRGSLRRVLQRVKYAGMARVTELVAAAALPTFQALLAITGPAPVVPVPLHRSRQRERGFNQAALIADALAGGAATRVAPILSRDRPTARQHGLDRAARLHNLAGAFSVGEAPVPAVVILVDDILTTSATLEACATVLRASGCERVFGFAVAREV